jgi:uncharacterized membrane protein YeiH
MTMIYGLDLFGTFVFAITGALLGIHKKLDLFGVLVVGFVTAVGGGTLRDLLVGNTPVFWLKDINYLAAVVVGSVVTFIFGKRVLRINSILKIADALGLGVFTAIGIRKGLEAELVPVFCVMMGMVTAVAGGMIRDILCQEIPMVLSREIYATACLAGGLCFFPLTYLGMPDAAAAALSGSVVFVLRMISIWMNLSLPKRS